MPLFSVTLFLQQYLIDHPPEEPAQTKSAEPEHAPLPAFQIKRILIWTHHLLALSKRKDIVNWSSELNLVCSLINLTFCI